MSDPVARERVGAASRGRRHPDEVRARISEAGMGRVLSPETKARIAASLRARKAPDPV
jgi:hypothetical protein